MKILCWNVRGLGNPRTLRALCHEVQSVKPLLVFLAETKSDLRVGYKIKGSLNFKNYFIVPSKASGGGLALLWNLDLDVSIMSFSLGHIDWTIKSLDLWWSFIGFYGNPSVEKSVESWNLLRRLKDCSKLLWILGGDFNEILFSHEKECGVVKKESQMESFLEAIDFCGLLDSGFVGEKFTCFKGTNRNKMKGCTSFLWIKICKQR